MIPRTLHQYLVRDAAFYPVLTLTGPRQSGKTTLARAAFSGHACISLEETEWRRFAQDDPRGFLVRAERGNFSTTLRWRGTAASPWVPPAGG